MGSNSFAPYYSVNTSFVVQNISPQKKCITIFQYPINYERTRDLLKIPGVSESDIRASLLKGELQHKIWAKDIFVTFSDIDLLQFNQAQKDFLSNAGISIGLSVSGSGGVDYVLKEDVSLIGTKDGSNRTFFTPDNFINGSHSGNLFKIELYHNGRLLLQNIDYRVSLTGPGTGFNTITFISLIPKSTSQLYADYYVAI